MGYVERHLLPDEQVLYKTRLHWILLLRPSLLIALGLVTVAVAWRMDAPPAVRYLGGAAAVAGLLWGLVHYIEMMTSEFAVTTIRLILKVGLVARYTTELL
ncbi:MAG: MFS transporter permease, partial [Candidatus Rokuibacteriota bacterium]